MKKLLVVSAVLLAMLGCQQKQAPKAPEPAPAAEAPAAAPAAEAPAAAPAAEAPAAPAGTDKK